MINTFKTILFCLLCTNLNAQTGNNQVSIFYRIEALSFSNELLDGWSDADLNLLEPEWLEAHPYSRMEGFNADSTGALLESLGYLQFDRYDDCRIQQIDYYDVEEPDQVIRMVFDYDIPGHKVTYKSAIVLLPTGDQSFIQRVSFQYDNDENITKIEQSAFNDNTGVWELITTQDFQNFDSCGYFSKSIITPGNAGSTAIAVNRTYVNGSCQPLLATFLNTTTNTALEKIAWSYNTDNQIDNVQILNLEDEFCDQTTIVYDQQGRRISLNTGECGQPADYVYAVYGWNNDNSLDWFTLDPEPMDTFVKIVLSYGACGSVATHAPTIAAPEISVQSPIAPGEMAAVFGLPGQTLVQWEMCDLQGRKVSGGQQPGNRFSVHVPAQLSSGVYVLKCRSGEQVWAAKMVVQ